MLALHNCQDDAVHPVSSTNERACVRKVRAHFAGRESSEREVCFSCLQLSTSYSLPINWPVIGDRIPFSSEREVTTEITESLPSHKTACLKGRY